MNNKKWIVIGVSLTITMLTAIAHAKKIYPAEIMGRSLTHPGLGWLGHVGIATATMSSAQDMKKNADQVLEILNEPVVGQINTITDFKSRSTYWGSRYGIADRNERGYRVLVEANHQRWWCPVYTLDTSYLVGQGNLDTGQPIKCGRWRCDTYAWWAFNSQGWDVMPGLIWLPVVLFNTFPYNNDERPTSSAINSFAVTEKRSLNDVTAEELNDMTIEEFQTIMNNPSAPPAHYVSVIQSAQMTFAYNEKLNDVKRGIMIDRLTSHGIEPDLTPKLIQLYHATTNTSIKEKIISGLMIHYQYHLNLNQHTDEQQLIKQFFSERLYETALTPKATDNIIRSVVDLHSAQELMAHLPQIDKRLTMINHTSSVMLKYALVHKSKVLQPIYMQSIVSELRVANDADLDSYLFGPLSIAYQNKNKTVLEPTARQLVINYLKQVQHKYTAKGLQENPTDSHRHTTAPYYFALVKQMDVQLENQ